jgi:hypothetical protein
MDEATYEVSAMADSKAVEFENAHLPHDSMVTVRLSEPPSLTVVTQSLAMSEQQEDCSGEDIPLDTPDSSIEFKKGLETTLPSGHSMSIDREGQRIDSLQEMSDEQLQADADERRGSESTEDSADGEVNWAELEKTEEQEPRDQDSENVGWKLLPCDVSLANLTVYCIIARQTGAGEQPSGYKPEIRPSTYCTIETKRQPVSTSFNAATKENG